MKVIRRNKKTVLVQDEKGFQFYVPVEVYDTEEIAVKDIYDAGIPKSLSFDLILEEESNLSQVAEDLYSQNIHTLEDVLNNRKKVNDILRKHFSAQTIINAVKGG